MSKDINSMSYTELRNEVQRLHDEIARMKKLLTDTLENLGEENFSSQLIKEKDQMKSQITVTAKKIESTVSKTDLENSLSKYTTIKQTADAISTLASKSAELANAVLISDISEAVDTSKIYVIQEQNKDNEVVSETYYYFNDLSKKWEILSGDSIYTVFEQTPEGFSLKGNVVIDGNTVVTKDLTLSGNVKWEMDNSPVKTRYSTDGVSWEIRSFEDGDIYMQMSFDGGKTWSKSTKVVGTDGKNGANGSNADVTPENVFNALTNNGAQQGIFAAFVNNNNQIYINAEFLASKISKVADTLYVGEAGDSGTKSIYFKDAVNISTYQDGYDAGLRVNANSFQIVGATLDLEKCSNVKWGNNTPVAVFGAD